MVKYFNQIKMHKNINQSIHYNGQQKKILDQWRYVG